MLTTPPEKFAAAELELVSIALPKIPAPFVPWIVPAFVIAPLISPVSEPPGSSIAIYYRIFRATHSTLMGYAHITGAMFNLLGYNHQSKA